ncbi:MAG TPA: hypothetical protein VK172_14910 [Lentimicrobium sp.]|nr:hypothetical protein [Bacteroidales bacterium]HLO92453.1 hypothetical protein [Lentimicrobium sp.]
MEQKKLCSLLKYPPSAEICMTLGLDDQDVSSKVIWDGTRETLTIFENGVPLEIETGSQGLLTFIEIFLAANHKRKS